MKPFCLLLICQSLLFFQGFSQETVHYELKMQPDYKQEKIFIQLELRLPEKETPQFFLLSDKAKIVNMKVGGADVKRYLHKNDTLSFPKVKNMNRLEMQYTLPMRDYVASNAILLRREGRWYPVLKDVLFSSKIEFSPDERYYAVSSGEKVVTGENITYSNDVTNELHLMLLPVAGFSEVTIVGEKINFNFYRDRNAPAFDEAFYNEFVDSYAYFSDFFASSPLEKELAIIEIPDKNFEMCQSLKGTIIFGEIFYQIFPETKTKSWIPHEVCHQWWGNSLYFSSSAKNFRFMEESVTEYLKGLYIGKVHGSIAYDSLYQDYGQEYKKLIFANQDVPVSRIGHLDTPDACTIIYAKGPMMLKMLVATSKFDLQTAISQFYRRYAGSAVTYQDFSNFLPDKDFGVSLDRELDKEPVEYTFPQPKQ